jgi:hypothetical protein
MVYTLPGGEATLRSLPADAAIKNLPQVSQGWAHPATAPRLPTGGIRPPVAPVAGGAAAAAGGSGAGLGLGAAVAYGSIAFVGSFVITSAFVDAVGIKYPGDQNALQFFSRRLGIGSSGATQEPVEITVEGSPPFTGGQSDGFLYTVTIDSVSASNLGDQSNQPRQSSFGLYGPITRLSWQLLGSFFWGEQWRLNWTGRTTPDGAQTSGGITLNTNGTDPIVSVARADGLPDTGGNIAGLPEASTYYPPNTYNPGTVPQTIPGEETPDKEKAPLGPPLPSSPPPESEPINPSDPDFEKPKVPFFLPPPLPAGAPLPGAGASGNPNAVPVNPPQSNPTGAQPPTKAPPTTTNDCRCNIPLFNRFDKLNRDIGNLINAGNAGANAAILAALEQLKGAVGVGAFPASLPANFANPTGGQKNISNLAEMQLWNAEQLDGLIGQFPNKTTVSTPDGDKDVELPNVSESLSEIIGMLVGLTVITNENLHTSSRALMQAGSATQQAHLAHLFSKANAEFMGYEGRPSDVDVPMAFTPGGNPFEGLLNEGTQKIKGWTNNDSQDLKSIFAELLHAAAIIRAVYWRKLDARGDFKQQIQQEIRNQSKFVDDEGERRNSSSDWEEYLRQVETGFTSKTGDQSPYNRNPNEGPKIRDLSDGNTSNGG